MVEPAPEAAENAMGNPQAVIGAGVIVIAAEVDPEIVELEKSLAKLQAKFDIFQVYQRKLVEQNAAILADLECPVCFGYFTDKRVIMCENGHNVCENCNYGLDICPVGRCTLGRSRNLFLEMASSKAQRPCKYAEEGCFEIHGLLETAERELHEGSCQHRFQCKMFLSDNEADEVAYCQWRGKRNEYLAHCEEIHPTTLINVDEAVLRVPIPAASARNYLEISFPFRCHNEIFLLAFNYHKDAHALVPVPMFLGKQDNLKKFRIAISFVGKNNVTAKFTCLPREPVREEFSAILFQNPHLDRSMLKIFGERNTIDCAVKITLIE